MLECELSPAARQDMASHIGREESASVVASSARAVVGLHLLIATAGVSGQLYTAIGGNMRGASKSSSRSKHTMIQAPQPSIGLIFCVLCLAHCVVLSVQMRLGAGLHTGQAGACR